MATNQEIIKKLYAVAEGDQRDPSEFASLFHDDGYFEDQSSGMRLQGRDVGKLIEGVSSAFPDMHRKLLHMYETAGEVVVELRLQGTHTGDFHTGDGVLPATGRAFDVPCCDVFRLKDGRVEAFHCYNQLSVWLKQLGAFECVAAAMKR